MQLQKAYLELISDWSPCHLLSLKNLLAFPNAAFPLSGSNADFKLQE